MKRTITTAIIGAAILAAPTPAHAVECEVDQWGQQQCEEPAPAPEDPDTNGQCLPGFECEEVVVTERTPCETRRGQRVCRVEQRRIQRNR